MAQIVYDERKLEELMLYIARRCETDPTFGATKLCKILFFADFGAYAAHGEPITGAAYKRLAQGPVPTMAAAVRSRLISSKRAFLRTETIGPHEQHKLLAMREADLRLFTGIEISIVNDVILKLWGRTAADVSDMSHGFIGWELAQANEVIPYHTVCLPVDPIDVTDDDRSWAAAVAANF